MKNQKKLEFADVKIEILNQEMKNDEIGDRADMGLRECAEVKVKFVLQSRKWKKWWLEWEWLCVGTMERGTDHQLLHTRGMVRTEAVAGHGVLWSCAAADEQFGVQVMKTVAVKSRD
ncbi:hypothetical protein C5167_017125 [Papaver somniferum]|uniref:Uncharacterized protein n=1 Tax=Papaver somniferum TaxID=3469 RepID=A0A4Y7IML1_PAPSO|nr:hypothetical protein C5167_017125 [Papaver somniferum]